MPDYSIHGDTQGNLNLRKNNKLHFDIVPTQKVVNFTAPFPHHTPDAVEIDVVDGADGAAKTKCRPSSRALTLTQCASQPANRLTQSKKNSKSLGITVPPYNKQSLVSSVP